LSDLRRRGVATGDAANAVVGNGLAHNRQFAFAAQDPEPAWRVRPWDLDQLFCFQFHRVMTLVPTVRVAALPGHHRVPDTVRTSAAGLTHQPRASSTGTPPSRGPHAARQTGPGKPAENHPWRGPGRPTG
jgi:hypothetical protein